MAPLVAGDGQVLNNGELEEYLEKNLNAAKVHRFSSFFFSSSYHSENDLCVSVFVS